MSRHQHAPLQCVLGENRLAHSRAVSAIPKLLVTYPAGQLEEDLRAHLSPYSKLPGGKVREPVLQHGLQINVKVYNQAGLGARDSKGVVVATGSSNLSPQWLLQAALDDVHIADAISTGVLTTARSRDPKPLLLPLHETILDGLSSDGCRSNGELVGSTEVLLQVCLLLPYLACYWNSFKQQLCTHKSLKFYRSSISEKRVKQRLHSRDRIPLHSVSAFL